MFQSPDGCSTSPKLADGGDGGHIALIAQSPMVASCTEHVARYLAHFGAAVTYLAASGDTVPAEQPILCIENAPPAPIIEAAVRFLVQACAIASAAADLVEIARKTNPFIQLAWLDTQHSRGRSVVRRSLTSGGIAVNPASLATPLDIRSFAGDTGEKPVGKLQSLRNAAGSPTVIEVWSMNDIDDAILAAADILILNDFTPEDVWRVRNRIFGRLPRMDIAVKGNITAANIVAYSAAGTQILVIADPLSVPCKTITLEPIPAQSDDRRYQKCG